MRKLFSLFILGLIILSFERTNGQNGSTDKKVRFNQGLANEFKNMAIIDQVAANFPSGEYINWSKERWIKFADSIFNKNKKRLKEVFSEFGYPGYDLVGREGEADFWVMVQHCDSDTNFQRDVLNKLTVEAKKKNADPRHFGLLTDRLRINTGMKQTYGTQVRYNNFGQAFPKSLDDSSNVNKRRDEIGLEPIEQYLNMMTIIYFEGNKEQLKAKGIIEPKLFYKTDFIIKMEK